MTNQISRAVVLATLAGCLTAAAAPAAGAETNVAAGTLCDATWVTDPTVEGNIGTGEIHGGPLVAASAGATIGLTCVIQIGWDATTHAADNACDVSSSYSLQVAILPPTGCSFILLPDEPVHVCSLATVNDVTYYWDGQAGTWSLDDNVPCGSAIVVGCDVIPCPVPIPAPPGTTCEGNSLATGCYYWDGGQWRQCTLWAGECLDHVVESTLYGLYSTLDPVYCPVLRSLTTSYVPGVLDVEDDGDVYVLGSRVLDCPPYYG